MIVSKGSRKVSTSAVYVGRAHSSARSNLILLIKSNHTLDLHLLQSSCVRTTCRSVFIGIQMAPILLC